MYQILKAGLINLSLKSKITSLLHHPSIIKDIIQGNNLEQIRIKIRKLDERSEQIKNENEISAFMTSLKQSSYFYIDPHNDPKLNRLCCIEDWQNREINEIISELQKISLYDYIHRENWEMRSNIVNNRKAGLIHRKDWEWALGIIAMRRFGKLNEKCTAIGVGAGREEVLFYLANHLGHVYATDLYDGKDWRNFAPSDFPDNPKKYAPFPYKEDALTVLRMDATNLEFPSDTFDIAFSFSSIEHFGGKNHAGALRSLREVERVLKTGGIATITTEYILNDKENPEFFNRRTIYNDLINKLDKLQLVEPLDLRITTKTLDTAMGLYYTIDNTHPHILVRYGDVLLLLCLFFKNNE